MRVGCAECERLKREHEKALEEYVNADRLVQLVAQYTDSDSAILGGFRRSKQDAQQRLEAARRVLENHEATHNTKV
jgi:hypothetical protein